MARWQKGKVFRKGGRLVRYVYRNGKKWNRRLVEVEKMYRTGKRYYGYGKRFRRRW